MLNRRTLFQASTTIGGAVAAFFGGRKAQAKIPAMADVEPRGADRRLERLPTLDVESREDFLTHFRIWVNGDVRKVAEKRGAAIMEAKGIDPRTPMPHDDADVEKPSG
jgi:hypothetical protein